MIDKKKKRSISRREFIGKTAAAAAFTIVPRYVLGGNGYTAPSDKLNMACIGVGGMGYKDTCLLYTSPSPRDLSTARMPSSA